MSRRKSGISHSTPSGLTGKVALLIAVAAFGAGAGTTWLILREQTQQPYFPSATSTMLASDTDSASALPNVSQAPPAQAAVTLANENYDHKNWAKAIELYQRAISLGSDKADVRTDLGNAYRFSGEPQKALEQYQIAQREDSQHEHSLFNTATLYAQVLNDPSKAVETWREYLRRFPQGENATAARQLLAEVETQDGNHAKVADWLRKEKPSSEKSGE